MVKNNEDKIGIVTMENIDNCINITNDVSHKGSKLPPLNKGKDKYSKLKIRTNILINLFKKIF